MHRTTRETFIALSPLFAVMVALLVIIGLSLSTQQNIKEQLKAQRVVTAEVLINAEDPHARLLKNTVKIEEHTLTAQVAFNNSNKLCVFPEFKTMLCSNN